MILEFFSCISDSYYSSDSLAVQHRAARYAATRVITIPWKLGHHQEVNEIRKKSAKIQDGEHVAFQLREAWEPSLRMHWPGGNVCVTQMAEKLENLVRFKVDGTSFPDAGSLVTTAHVMCEICPRDLKYRESKTNRAVQKLLHTRCFFSCLSEIGSKRKLFFGRQQALEKHFM